MVKLIEAHPKHTQQIVAEGATGLLNSQQRQVLEALSQTFSNQDFGKIEGSRALFFSGSRVLYFCVLWLLIDK